MSNRNNFFLYSKNTNKRNSWIRIPNMAISITHWCFSQFSNKTLHNFVVKCFKIPILWPQCTDVHISIQKIANDIKSSISLYGTLWKTFHDHCRFCIIIEITTTTFTFYKTIFDTKLFWWSKLSVSLLNFQLAYQHYFHWKRIFSYFFCRSKKK